MKNLKLSYSEVSGKIYIVKTDAKDNVIDKVAVDNENLASVLFLKLTKG